MDDQVIKFEVRCEAKCLRHLPLLRIAVCKQDIHDSFLSLMFKTECNAERIAYTFAERSRPKRNIADAGFHVTGESAWNAEIFDEIFDGAQALVLSFTPEEVLECVCEN